MKRTKRTHKVLGPILVMGIITFALMILSVILSLIGVESEEAIINGTNLEMSLVSIRSVLSLDGIKYLLSSCITNFRMMEALPLRALWFLPPTMCTKSLT